MGKMKLTGLEKKWVLYDVANSAFTMMVSTLIPIYFNSLAKSSGVDEALYLAYWGYAISISTLLVVLMGPSLGAVSDRKDRKKTVFSFTIVLGAAACAVLGFARQWMIFLVVFIVAKVLYSLSLIVYDSTLPDVTTEERMDTVSSQGYAWGYIGSCVPFIACLVLVLKAESFGISMGTAMTVSFIIVALWWGLISLPLLRSYKQKNYIEKKPGQPGILAQLWNTLKDMFRNKKVFLFVLSFFFYIDGVYTIIDMATAYGDSLGIGQSDLLLALLVTQFVAFPCAIIFGYLAHRYRSEILITICIAAYFCIAVYAIFLAHAYQFWVLAVCVGMFQGGIQALSRSYFTKIIPAEKSGEYFGFLDICGKGASILGTFTVGFLTHITGHQQLGVGAIAVFFIAGLILFRKSVSVSTTK